MTLELRTLDQVPGCGLSDGPRLRFEVGEITGREIVRARVTAEVERLNSGATAQTRHWLVEPAPLERELNAQVETSHRRTLDVDNQIEVALAAVRNGRVILLFNGIHVRDLDEPLLVTPVSEARFLRLVPLVGG